MLWKPRAKFLGKEEGKKNKETMAFLEPGSQQGKILKELTFAFTYF